MAERHDKQILFIRAIIFIVLSVVFVHSISAINASSSSYSIGMFGNGVISGSVSGSYSARFVTLESPGTRNAVSGSYLTNVGFFGNTGYHDSVRINSYSISPRSAVIGSTIGLYISALNAESVWAKITSPNGQQQILTLINNNLVNYLPSPSVVGRYNVIFYANSSDGATASVLDYFDLVEQPEEPDIPPSSGGGGGALIIQRNCTYIWDCTPWSVCSDGKQTRQCSNVGSCTGNENKPSEEISCTESLFDISLGIKDIKLLNNTLAFNIDLIEKMSNQKIDVHIKYSIIDSDNKEIYSQIETKAIDSALFYEKELKDLHLVDGEYILRVDVLYGNLQRAFAEQKFSINNIKIEGILGDRTITGKVTDLFFGDETDYKIYLWILLIVVLFLLRKKVSTVFGNIHSRLSGLDKQKHRHNSVRGLIGKKVYSESGDYLGKVEDIILGKSRIESLKIKLDQKHHKGKGIAISYNAVKSVKEVVIVQADVFHKMHAG
jgi:sporulation protein YlmC with PRC-barrel domain